MGFEEHAFDVDPAQDALEQAAMDAVLALASR
jgi:hypothetical protein